MGHSWVYLQWKLSLKSLNKLDSWLQCFALVASSWNKSPGNKRSIKPHTHKTKDPLVCWLVTTLFFLVYPKTYSFIGVHDPYIHTYLPTYIHTYLRTYIHTYIHTCMHAYIHTYLYIYLHITLPLFDGSILVNTGQYPEPDINWCLDILYQLLFKYFYPGLFFGNLWSLPSDSPHETPTTSPGTSSLPAHAGARTAVGPRALLIVASREEDRLGGAMWFNLQKLWFAGI